MAPRTPRAILAAVAASALAAVPAAAQFGSIFGDPPLRPPSDVPSRPPIQQQRPPQPDLPPPTRLPPGAPPSQIQSRPLSPPPGGPGDPRDFQRDPSFPREQGSFQRTPSSPPAAQRPRGTPQPANTAPQGDDEVISEAPAIKINNPRVVFSGLDKITGRIISFDVAIDETVQFGALQVTPRVCYSRPATESQQTDGFVEVDEVTLQGEVKRIFTGWMFAASPGLHAVEHSIYDVWLTDCKGGAVAAAPEPPPATARPAAPERPARRSGAATAQPAFPGQAREAGQPPSAPTQARPRPRQESLPEPDPLPPPPGVFPRR